MNLKRYWFEFDFSEKPQTSLVLGVGVTAYGYDDALQLIQERVFKDKPMPGIHKFIENVDISTLDPNHIRPNIYPPIKRGVWFPMGYDPYV